MDSNSQKNNSPIKFFLLVLMLSIPFWILGALARDFTEILPIKLPISALMTFCPLLAAVILIYRQRKTQGVKELLTLAFDFKKIRNKKWYMPIVFLMPVNAALSYAYVKIAGVILPESKTSLLFITILFFVYFICAIGEEVGWSGYVMDPLQNRYGALKSSIILGVLWAIWHIIPWSQTHQTTTWIVWQSIGTVFLRIIMVWIFNNTGKSVFAMVLFHTMTNISPYLIPNYGPHYDPFISTVLLILTTIAITYLWGAKTLVRFRYS